MWKRIFALALVPLFLTGCTSITNLTSSRQVRNDNNLYLVEMAWASRQQTIIKPSIKPYVMLGTQLFEMRPVGFSSNRWETLVPVSAAEKNTTYRFRVDYQVRTFSGPDEASLLSNSYKLLILDR